MNLLIPYVNLIDHEDPLFKEYTYGSIGQRGDKLKASLKNGNYIFFHTTFNNKKYITAYYVVDRVIETKDVVGNKILMAKYKNPHINDYLNGYHHENDYIVFGDPILSKILERPLPFNKDLSQKLSLNIKFPIGKTDTQIIGSATRSWRELTGNDIEILLQEIEILENKSFDLERIFSTEEIVELLERDIENHLEKNHKIFGKEIISVKRQVVTPIGRIDLLFENQDNSVTIAELKLGKIGNEAVSQLWKYINWARAELKKEISGVIVCSGVMPAFQEDLSKLKNIKIFCYGWQMKVIPWGLQN